uniref:annexin A9 isoform X3 n=1 Tax=Ictidomys tridecemlineatus TaxID=43179 RepID=UPI001A9CEA3B|nr:annexin A9 isoform X3 [Ictidomys tridecemlineatus]
MMPSISGGRPEPGEWPSGVLWIEPRAGPSPNCYLQEAGKRLLPGPRESAVRLEQLLRDPEAGKDCSPAALRTDSLEPAACRGYIICSSIRLHRSWGAHTGRKATRPEGHLAAEGGDLVDCWREGVLSCGTMSASSREMGPSLTPEILSHLGLANKTAAWGTLGTLRTFLSFSVDKDVQRLLKAITGQGVDCGAIVDVLTNRSREQRQLISRAFQERTQQGGRESYSGIIDYNLAEQDVQALRQDEGRSTEGPWVLILTQRNPKHLTRVFEQYQRRTGQELEEAVRTRFRGEARAALLSLASVIRNTPLYFADKLHRALQESEPNYQVLMRILISRSETDLLSIRAEFKKKFGKSLYSSLQDAVTGDCRSALLALCRAEDI